MQKHLAASKEKSFVFQALFARTDENGFEIDEID